MELTFLFTTSDERSCWSGASRRGQQVEEATDEVGHFGLSLTTICMSCTVWPVHSFVKCLLSACLCTVPPSRDSEGRLNAVSCRWWRLHRCSVLSTSHTTGWLIQITYYFNMNCLLLSCQLEVSWHSCLSSSMSNLIRSFVSIHGPTTPTRILYSTHTYSW